MALMPLPPPPPKKNVVKNKPNTFQARIRCEVIHNAWDAEVFNHQIKHREESWKYNAQRSIFTIGNQNFKHDRCDIFLGPIKLH